VTTVVTTRNALCRCGSGVRYKACCGRIPAAAAPPPLPPEVALRLGVAELQNGDHERALRRLLEVAKRVRPLQPAVAHPLATAVASLLASRAPVESEAHWLAYQASLSASRSPDVAREARVSVVVPSHNHAAYIEGALASAVDQTRPALEIVVIDDGSVDGSPERIRAFADRHRDRVRFAAREGRGAPATINEAVRSARGDWIAILNSDDRFTPDRLDAMVDGVAGAGAAWGYSRCAFIDAVGAAIPPGVSAQVDSQRNAFGRVGTFDTIGFGLVAGNTATSSGMLFFSRDLFDRVDGFRDYRYVHDWDFCLRAVLEAEPAYVPRDVYEYRLHGRNTFLGGGDEPKDETLALLVAWFRDAMAHDGSGNPWAPTPARWGRLFALRAIEAGAAMLLPPGTIEQLAGDLVAELAG